MMIGIIKNGWIKSKCVKIRRSSFIKKQTLIFGLDYITNKALILVKFNVLNSSRLDVAVAKELQISRNQALNLIKDSLVSVNLKPVSKPSFLLSENDEICVNFAPKKEIQNEYEVNFDIPISTKMTIS